MAGWRGVLTMATRAMVAWRRNWIDGQGIEPYEQNALQPPDLGLRNAFP